MQPEVERLQFQQALLKLARGGNYAAPLHQPEAILDVACGTGLWCRELGDEFPHARVYGFDQAPTWLCSPPQDELEPSEDRAARLSFQIADALKPFPFRNALFDLSHAQLISGWVPVAQFPTLVAELYRVTAPGGYVEVVDTDLPTSPSAAFQALWGAVEPLMVGQGYYPGAGPHLTGYLRRARLVEVQERQVIASSTHPDQQHLLLPVLLQASAGMEQLLVAGGLLSNRQGKTLLSQIQQNLPLVGASWTIVTAFGKRDA